jgi:hypothetical protein
VPVETERPLREAGIDLDDEGRIEN